MERPIAAFDIETVPDVEVGRRVLGLSGDFRAVADGMLEARREETAGRTDFLKPPVQRIVTIAIAWWDAERRQFKLDALGGGQDLDEGALLEAFFKVVARRPRLVSWNGNGFDMPVIRYRAMLHGIDASPYYAEPDRYNNYLSRYHDMHTDLMDVLSGYGASERVGLDDICRVFGLPGKTVTEGHRVYHHIARGEWDLVKTYCELDSLNTLLLYLTYELSRGRLAPAEFLATRDRIGSELARDPRPPVSGYAEALKGYLPGTTRAALAQELA